MATEIPSYKPEKIYPGQQPHHIIEAQQFTREWMEEDLFPLTQTIKQMRRDYWGSLLDGVMGYNLFYQASTRTRTSFSAALSLMGGTSEGTENARAFSSTSKGETLEDTIRILNGYKYDHIILRYDEEGGAERAALVSDVPVINAGDGIGQHPTQALLDVFTIKSELGRIDGLKVAMIGDLLRGRTVHSLAYLLAKYQDMEMFFVSPHEFGLKPEIKDHLDEHGVKYSEHDNIQDVLSDVDVAYITRPQTEMSLGNGGGGNNKDLKSSKYRIGLKELQVMHPDSRILHPLPRTSELPPKVDNDPRVAIFRQAENGLYVRMALLYSIHQDKTKRFLYNGYY